MRRVVVLGVVSMLVGALAANALVLTGPRPAAAASPVSLGASIADTQWFILPPPAGPEADLRQSVAATDSLAGKRGWVFGIVNTSGSVVTDPAITVDSGWSPSLFPGLMAPLQGACPSSVTRQGTAFPYTWTDAALPLGLDDNCYLASGLPGVSGLDNPPGVMGAQEMMWQGGDFTSVAPPITFSPGYDSFRDLDTAVVGPGGSQVLTVGVTVRDASIPLMVVQFSSFMTPEGITAVTHPDVPDCTAASDPGETCLWWWNMGPRPDVSPGQPHMEWNLRNPVPGHQYVFVATFTNLGDTPVSMIPGVDLVTPRTFANDATITDTNVHVAVPGLVGDAPHPGTADFTIGAGQAANWTSTTTEFPWVTYAPANYPLSFDWSGFFAPIDNPGAGSAPVYNLMKAGAAVPVRFSLHGDQGLGVITSVTADQIACSAFATLDGVETTVTAGHSGLSYDPSSDTYTYVWKTDRTWSSSSSACRVLDVKLSDGTHHRAYFKFTR